MLVIKTLVTLCIASLAASAAIPGTSLNPVLYKQAISANSLEAARDVVKSPVLKREELDGDLYNYKPKEKREELDGDLYNYKPKEKREELDGDLYNYKPKEKREELDGDLYNY